MIGEHLMVSHRAAGLSVAELDVKCGEAVLRQLTDAWTRTGRGVVARALVGHREFPQRPPARHSVRCHPGQGRRSESEPGGATTFRTTSAPVRRPREMCGDRLPGAGERLNGDEEDVLHPRRMLEDRDGSVGADEEHASFGGDEDHGGWVAGRQRG